MSFWLSASKAKKHLFVIFNHYLLVVKNATIRMLTQVDEKVYNNIIYKSCFNSS